MSRSAGGAARLLRAALAPRVPWPEGTLHTPLNPSPAALLAWGAGSPSLRPSCVRLAFALPLLSIRDAITLLRLAVAATPRLLAADAVLAERNLALPAHWVTRGLLWLAGGTSAYWAAGGLEGLVREAGLHVAERRPLALGAAALLRLEAPAQAAGSGATRPAPAEGPRPRATP